MLILQRLRVFQLPNVLWPSSFPAPFEEISWDRFSKNGADVNQVESHFPGYLEKMDLKQGKRYSEQRIEVQSNPKYIWIQENEVYPPKMLANKVVNPTALGRHAFCKGKSRAGDATVLDLPVENLRPCSRVTTALYG